MPKRVPHTPIAAVWIIVATVACALLGAAMAWLLSSRVGGRLARIDLPTSAAFDSRSLTEDEKMPDASNIVLKWNGVEVLNGKASAVTAAETAAAFMTGHFNGSPFRKWAKDNLGRSTIANRLLRGEPVSLAWSHKMVEGRTDTATAELSPA